MSIDFHNNLLKFRDFGALKFKIGPSARNQTGADKPQRCRRSKEARNITIALPSVFPTRPPSPNLSPTRRSVLYGHLDPAARLAHNPYKSNHGSLKAFVRSLSRSREVVFSVPGLHASRNRRRLRLRGIL